MSTTTATRFRSGRETTRFGLVGPNRTRRAARIQKATRLGAGTGAAALLASTVLFPLSDMTAKSLTTSVPGLEIAWMRYLALMVILVPMIVMRPGILRTRVPHLQVGRGLCSVAATSFAIAAFGFLPVGDATAIGFVTPILVLALAAPILKETVGLPRWAAALVGFCGVLVIVQPGSGTFQVGAILPLISSLFSAGTVITTRLGQAERVHTTLVWSSLTGFAILSALVVPWWHHPSLGEIELAAVMGGLAALGTALQIVAYRSAPSSVLAPITYAQLIWAGSFEWLFTGHVPGPAMIAGSLIVASSGLFVALWARRRVDESRRAGSSEPLLLQWQPPVQAAA